MNDNFEAASINDLKELDIKASPVILLLEEFLADILDILQRNSSETIVSLLGVSQPVFGRGKLKLLDIVNLSLNFTEDTRIMEIMQKQRVAAVLLVKIMVFTGKIGVLA